MVSSVETVKVLLVVAPSAMLVGLPVTAKPTVSASVMVTVRAAGLMV